MKAIVLKSDRERPILRMHPWIFANSISEVRGDPEFGETVEVLTHGGDWLAYASFSPHSQIRARIWTWDPSERVDQGFFTRRLEKSIAFREGLFKGKDVTAYREVYAESDGLPGLIVDRYGDMRVIQFLCAGAERWRESIIEILSSRKDCKGIFERSDVDVRALEGLPAQEGQLFGETPGGLITIVEYGIHFYVDIFHGHKTGFYLDQRENRKILRDMMPDGASVLDSFSYTGGFTLNALKANAGEILAIDSSSSSLDLIDKNLSLNRFDPQRIVRTEGDVFSELRVLRDQDRKFDVIILDPPKFASTPSHIQRAARGYKDINILAFKLLREGGLLFTFSCSGGVSAELFQKIIAGAALDAGKRVSIIKWLGQPEDHPVLVSFPEARYLKGFACRVTS
jgi:23S rRNA (cytosine1962-C5)-methyltransferase